MTGAWRASGNVCSTIVLGDAPDPATLIINGTETLSFTTGGGFASTVEGQTYLVTVPHSYFDYDLTHDAGAGLLRRRPAG